MRTFGLLLFLGLLAFTPAQASVIQYSITSDHCTGGCLASGDTAFGTITLTDIGLNTVRVNISLDPTYQFVSTGFDADFGFNLIGNPTITSFALVTPATGWSLIATTAGSLHMDGTGNFEYGLNCDACGTGGSNPQPSPLTFNITASGLSTSSFAELNAAGNFFAIDIISLSSGGGTGNTGAVDVSSSGVICTTCPAEVPEPSTLALMIGGFLVVTAKVIRRYV